MLGRALGELEWRGLIAQTSDRAGLESHLSRKPQTLYCGFDPTADSLHIGNLVPLLTLRRFQELGHRPIVLVGGATGLIGDPTFRKDERALNSTDVVEVWARKIRRQVEPFLSFEGPNSAMVVDNLEWTAKLDVITFLRDIGKHFSVNSMIQRDSIRSRLERDGQGISFTEFSYMLLQGMDFLELARRYDCRLQIGGSDQWGNIVSGIPLIRRELSQESFGLTVPLVTKADGSKFGKTASGTIWLDANKTSPYSFYQFWLNTSDADVVQYLRYFSFLSTDNIERLKESVVESPQARLAQKELARAVTKLVHGEQSLLRAENITAALFNGDLCDLDESDISQLVQDGMQVVDAPVGTGLLTCMLNAGIVKSTTAARGLVQSGAVSMNGRVISDGQKVLQADEALFGRYYLVRKGKKSWFLIILQK